MLSRTTCLINYQTLSPLLRYAAIILFDGVSTWRSLCFFDDLSSIRPETHARLSCSGLGDPARGERNDIARWFGFEFEFRFHPTAAEPRSEFASVASIKIHTKRISKRTRPADLTNADGSSSESDVVKTFGTKRFFSRRGRAHITRHHNEYAYVVIKVDDIFTLTCFIGQTVRSVHNTRGLCEEKLEHDSSDTRCYVNKSLFPIDYSHWRRVHKLSRYTRTAAVAIPTDGNRFHSNQI